MHDFRLYSKLHKKSIEVSYEVCHGLIHGFKKRKYRVPCIVQITESVKDKSRYPETRKRDYENSSARYVLNYNSGVG